jgi:glycosyltransferase involved in cell wall biosynthesis
MTPNVLHAVDSLGLGGTQSILKQYFEAHREDRRLHLYALRCLPQQVRIDHPNVLVHARSRRFSLRPLFELRTILSERSVGILHCHLFRSQVFGYLAKLLFAPHLALIFHEHGRAVGREGESGLEAFLFRCFLRIAWRRVERFVCISELTRTRLLQLIPGARDRTTVVANPIPVWPHDAPADTRVEARASLEIPDGSFVVGFASRLVERKGWADFLAAIALLAPRSPIYFLLAGDGEDRVKVEARVAELGIADRGRVLGHVDWMQRFYSALDCFVMPSHWEPHGLAHLEAQSFGVPVIVSRVPGLESTVHADVDALLFKVGDVEDLAECITRLSQDTSLRIGLASAGLANAAHYSMDAFSASLDTLYVTAKSDAQVGEPAADASVPPRA